MVHSLVSIRLLSRHGQIPPNMVHPEYVGSYGPTVVIHPRMNEHTPLRFSCDAHTPSWNEAEIRSEAGLPSRQSCLRSDQASWLRQTRTPHTSEGRNFRAELRAPHNIQHGHGVHSDITQATAVPGKGTPFAAGYPRPPYTQPHAPCGASLSGEENPARYAPAVELYRSPFDSHDHPRALQQPRVGPEMMAYQPSWITTECSRVFGPVICRMREQMERHPCNSQQAVFSPRPSADLQDLYLRMTSLPPNGPYRSRIANNLTRLELLTALVGSFINKSSSLPDPQVETFEQFVSKIQHATDGVKAAGDAVLEQYGALRATLWC